MHKAYLGLGVYLSRSSWKAEEGFLRRKRRFLLSLVFIVASFLAFTVKRIFDYAAAPREEKESNFVFPGSPDQEKPTVLIVEPSSLPVIFRQSGGFTNDASHLNRTAIYGIVKIANEEDLGNALKFAREHHLKISCAGQ